MRAHRAALRASPTSALEELATIVYTSGSTGLAQGRDADLQAHSTWSARLMSDVIRVETGGPHAVVPAAGSRGRAPGGAESIHVPRLPRVTSPESLETFAEDLRRARPTIFFSVPRLWMKFELGRSTSKLPKQQAEAPVPHPIRRSQAEAPHPRAAGARPGCAAPSPELRRSRGDHRAGTAASACSCSRRYGMSENMAYSHFTRPESVRVGYVGQANPGVEWRIGEGGEILVKSPAQMLGYYKEPEKTAECYTADGYFRTGDMGEVDAEGRLRITGRVKDLFKTSKGKYVAPVPIENKLGGHPQHRGCLRVWGEPSCHHGAPPALGRHAQGARARGAVRARSKPSSRRCSREVNSSLDPHEQTRVCGGDQGSLDDREWLPDAYHEDPSAT